jgi:hypothetical protein
LAHLESRPIFRVESLVCEERHQLVSDTYDSAFGLFLLLFGIPRFLIVAIHVGALVTYTLVNVDLPETSALSLLSMGVMFFGAVRGMRRSEGLVRIAIIYCAF